MRGERGDHDHHRSLWLTHGDVNGVDFWLDDEGCGRIVHQEGDADVTDSGSVVLLTANDWIGPTTKKYSLTRVASSSSSTATDGSSIAIFF